MDCVEKFLSVRGLGYSVGVGRDLGLDLGWDYVPQRALKDLRDTGGVARMGLLGLRLILHERHIQILFQTGDEYLVVELYDVALLFLIDIHLTYHSFMLFLVSRIGLLVLLLNILEFQRDLPSFAATENRTDD